MLRARSARARRSSRARTCRAICRRILRESCTSITAESSPDRADVSAGQVPTAQPDADHRLAAAHEPLVAIEHAHVWLGGRHVLRDITWRLLEHEHWLVTGANGAGKSSFLRLIHGQLRPALGGEIRWPALDDPRNVWTLRKRVAWVAAELQAGYRYPTTVRECVASGFESSIGLTRRPNDEETSARRDASRAIRAHRARAAQARNAVVRSGAPSARGARAGRASSHPAARRAVGGIGSAQRGAAQRSPAQRQAAGTQLVCASHLDLHRELFTHELVLERGAIASFGNRNQISLGSGTVPDPVAADPSATSR